MAGSLSGNAVAVAVKLAGISRLHRTTSTGTGLCARTSDVWLPSTSFRRPRRPWEAMTIKLQSRAFVTSMIASAG